MQKLLFVSSLVITGVIGLITIPVISRNLPSEKMAAISILFLLNAFFGVFDVLKPVFTRAFVQHRSSSTSIPVWHGCILSGYLGLGFSVIMYFVGVFFFDRFFDRISIMFLALGAIFFFFSIVFWSVLESTDRVGLSQFIKALSIAALYIFYCILSFFDIQLIDYAIIFASVQCFILAVYYFLSRGSINWSRKKESLWHFSEVTSTIQLNISKLIIDFSDRLIFAKLIPINIFAAYAISYDLAAKLNIFPQYLNAYMYPKLCASHVSKIEGKFFKDIKKHLLIAGVNFIILAFIALLLSMVTDELLAIYAGENYRQYGYILSYLIMVSAVYSFSFYGQILLRAMGNFSGLAKAFSVTAFISLGFALISYSVWGIDGFICAVVFFKSPGIGILAYIFDLCFSRFICIIFVIIVNLFIGFFIYLSFKDFSMALFSAIILFCISFCCYIVTYCKDRNWT